MDEIKTFTESDHKFNLLIEIVTECSRDIGMELGLQKCSKFTIRKRKKDQKISRLEKIASLKTTPKNIQEQKRIAKELVTLV